MRRLGSPQRAKVCARYFKTAKGEYGEGDRFLGLSVPQVRKLAAAYRDLKKNQLIEILRSPYHEERLLGVLIQVLSYQAMVRRQAPQSALQKKLSFYLNYKSALNNWDLVDTSAYKLLGHYCLTHRQDHVLHQLIQSPKHWDRRLAMIATYAYIKNNQLKLTLTFAKKCFRDPEDLMHKASGWMLREAYKIRPQIVQTFIQTYAPQMPRTQLRYALEKFPDQERRAILRSSKSNRVITT
jgi:3-methyladenine DNA glycosylase AlkD